jgi:hypothetical protein
MERSGRRGSDDVDPFLLLSLLSNFMVVMLMVQWNVVNNDGGMVRQSPFSVFCDGRPGGKFYLPNI